MAAKVPFVPAGFHSVTPYMVVKNSEEAIRFYVKAFGAQEVMCMKGPDGKSTMHAEIKIGNSHIMMGDENPQWGTQSAESLGASPVSLMVYVENVDAFVEKAVAAGCEMKYPVGDMFWGDRMGKIVDPFGYSWSIATHIEDVEPEEIGRRQKAWFAEMQAAATT
jgi:uncharacterized glyoxalase superfamily protein PhnB